MSAIFLDAEAVAQIDRDAAVAAVDAWFAGQIAAGFTTAGGWALGLRPEDVTLLTGNFVLAKEAAALSLPLPPVIDSAGVPHAMTLIEDLTSLMLAYGQHRASLSAEYATRKAAALESSNANAPAA